MAMVAYDPNGADTQLLQGWLMHDRFVLRGFRSGSAFELIFCRAARGLVIQHRFEPFHEAPPPFVAAGFQPEHCGYGYHPSQQGGKEREARYR
jgi:hypothetical protein